MLLKQDAVSRDSSDFTQVQLVIAGGYDPRVTENVEYKQVLCQHYYQHFSLVTI
jgi:hypothetical protein